MDKLNASLIFGKCLCKMIKGLSKNGDESQIEMVNHRKFLSNELRIKFSDNFLCARDKIKVKISGLFVRSSVYLNGGSRGSI